MDKREAVLAALTPSRGIPHSPVQVQKLLFLLDREIPDRIGGPHFEFQPYNYGPFDKAVYHVLQGLSKEGLAVIVPHQGYPTYAITPMGYEEGQSALDRLDDVARDYIERASEFVLKSNFLQLVSAVYKAYPEMRQNSVLNIE